MGIDPTRRSGDEAVQVPADHERRLRNLERATQVPYGINYGTATLVGGSVNVTKRSVTTQSIILLGFKTRVNPGFLSYVINSGSDFTIQSSSGTDASTVHYAIIEPKR